MSLSTFVSRHRHKILPLLLLIALVSGSIAFRHELQAWFTGQPVGTGRSPATVTQAGALQLALQVQPDPPQQQGNVVHLRVQDAGGAPVEAEEVSVVYSMPAMGAMPEMRGEAEVTKEATGRYRADFDLPMGGTWTLDTQVKAATSTAATRHSFTVGRPGLVPIGETASTAAPPTPQAPAADGTMPTAQKTPGLTVRMQTDPPRQRGNVVYIEAKDSRGTPMPGAKVEVEYGMPAMGSMPEMRGEAEVSEESDGGYRAAFDLPMGGTWTLETTATTPQGTQTARHTFTVGSPGLRPVGGAAAPDSPDGIVIDAQRRQRIGVRTAPLTKKPLHLTIPALGRITYDESRFTDVTLKLRGWVVTLYANTTGQYVDQGDTLLTLYSPELYAAQQEYLLALRSQAAAQRTGAPDRADYLVRAARQRLRLLDITAGQMQEIARRGEPMEQMPILAPASGYVVEKNIVAGAALEPGQRLYRLAALDRVWIEAEVYEADLPRVKVGQKAQITLPHMPGHHYTGTITYLYPYLQENTRTGRVRIPLPNRGMDLLPAMYANVEIQVNLGQRLVVPEEAVVYTGRYRLVFVDLGEGQLRPKEVELGLKSDGYYEVLRGVQEGDMIVTSGNFLVASEARLRAALQQWGSENGNQ
jgi:Cu(I)/Ag(I) efflux system membrane fusion protein